MAQDQVSRQSGDPSPTQAVAATVTQTQTFDMILQLLQNTQGGHMSHVVTAVREQREPWFTLFCTLDTNAAHGERQLEGGRTGAAYANQVIQQEREPIWQRWRDEAIRLWQAHPEWSITDVASDIRKRGLAQKPRSEKDYTVAHIRRHIRDLNPKARR